MHVLYSSHYERSVASFAFPHKTQRCDKQLANLRLLHYLNAVFLLVCGLWHVLLSLHLHIRLDRLLSMVRYVGHAGSFPHNDKCMCGHSLLLLLNACVQVPKTSKTHQQTYLLDDFKMIRNI